MRIKIAAFIAQGLLQALARIHAAGHYHGDVNPQNVLLRSDNQQKLQAVSLIDFALCKSQQILASRSVQMAHWTPPPEYYLNKAIIGSALDIWHTGVLLLEVIKGQTLDYSEDDVLSNRPREDALQMKQPMAQALAVSLMREPEMRPDALTLWRSLRSCL